MGTDGVLVQGPQLQYRRIKEREEYREATRGHNRAELIGACSRTLSNTDSSDLDPTERNDPLIVYHESGAEKERRAGATRSRVGVVSLAERDASRRGSDLPNWVGQVIELVKKTRETKRRRGAETKVKRPMERSGSRVGQRAGAEGGRRRGRGRGTRAGDANTRTRRGRGHGTRRGENAGA